MFSRDRKDSKTDKWHGGEERKCVGVSWQIITGIENSTGGQRIGKGKDKENFS